MKLSTRPEDILAEDQNSVQLGGAFVRKGTIAAFLKNIDSLEEADLSYEQRETVLQTMRELAPALIAAGLHKHAIFKNTEVQAILDDAAKLTS